MATIEAVRRRLLEDETEVEVLNFGAGKPRDRRSQEEMDAGWISHAVVSQVCKRAVSHPAKARLIFNLVRALRPLFALELGTCLGISAAYQGAALELNGRGQLISLEGAPSFGQIARETLAASGVSSVEVLVGRFHDTLPEALVRADAVNGLDFAFVDGHHDEEATKHYFGLLRGHAAPQAVILFDDIRWNTRMERAWHSIAADPGVGLAVDLENYGLVVLGAG